MSRSDKNPQSKFFKSRRRKGFTLIEAIIAMSVFMMITMLSVNLLKAASEKCAKIIMDAELLENARIGMDVILAHIREAKSVELSTDSDNTLIKLIATIETKKNPSVFTYNKNLIKDHARYHQIVFANNELASYIKDIKMRIEDEILYIAIITDADTDTDNDSNGIILRAAYDLRYKEIKN